MGIMGIMALKFTNLSAKGTNNEMNRYIRGFFVHNTFVELDRIGGNNANMREVVKIVERDIRYLKMGLVDNRYTSKAKVNDLYVKRF